MIFVNVVVGHGHLQAREWLAASVVRIGSWDISSGTDVGILTHADLPRMVCTGLIKMH
jgi:hypothetical protein